MGTWRDRIFRYFLGNSPHDECFLPFKLINDLHFSSYGIFTTKIFHGSSFIQHNHFQIMKSSRITVKKRKIEYIQQFHICIVQGFTKSLPVGFDDSLGVMQTHYMLYACNFMR
jgi:hypothetical protein